MIGHRAGFPGVRLLPAACVVIANMVGTGVFTTLGFQVASLSSGFTILVLWAFGGLCAICGALAYAELGAAIPRSGGEYALLSRIYSRPVGFLAGWISMIAGFPAAVAVAAIAFGRYVHGIAPTLDPKVCAVVMLLVTTLFHWRGVRSGSRFQTVATLLKLGLISGVVIFGLAAPWKGTARFTPAPGDLSEILSSPFAISLVFVMFAYSGWNAATYISGELANPARDVPRALLLGTGVVVVLYLALNWFFLVSTPTADLRGQVEVGLIVGRQAFGPARGAAMGAVIAALLVSSVSSMIWIGPRVTMTIGEDLPRLRVLARCSAEGAPRPAIVVQTLVTLLLMFTGTFEGVLIYLQFSLLLSSFVTAMGVYVLRRREPDLPRPVRAWGYPVTPAIFLAASLWMMVVVVAQRPAESLAGLASLVLGLALYGWAARPVAVAAATPGPGV